MSEIKQANVWRYICKRSFSLKSKISALCSFYWVFLVIFLAKNNGGGNFDDYHCLVGLCMHCGFQFDCKKCSIMKVLLLFAFFWCSAVICRADQLSFLSRADAENAVHYFNTIKKTVVLACYCCEDPEEDWFSYDVARIKDTGHASRLTGENFFQVELLNELRTLAVDLAYVHVDIQGMRMCVGEVLNMECDPCSLPAIVTRYLVTKAVTDGIDVSDQVSNSGGHLEFVQRNGLWSMSNLWVTKGTNSRGPIAVLDVQEFPETEENYRSTLMTFKWAYQNSYDSDKGVCDVVVIFVSRPEGEVISVLMKTEDGMEVNYEAILVDDY